MRVINRTMLMVMVLLSMLVFLVTASTASSAEAGKIKVGVAHAMKHAEGKEFHQGVVLAAEQVNAGGGIVVEGKKYEIEVVWADTNEFASTADAASAITKLITVDKVNFVLGGYRSEAVLAMQEVAADYKTIYISSGSAHPQQALNVSKNYERYKYFFRPWSMNSDDQRFLYLLAMSPLIRAVKNELGIERPKVALLIDHALWTGPISDLAKKVFPKMGCEVVGEWRAGFSATDLRPELTAIHGAGAHVIMYIQAGPAGAVGPKQWGELKIPAAMGGVAVQGATPGFWKASGGLCHYLASCFAVCPDLEITRKSVQFYKDYEKRWGYMVSPGIGHATVSLDAFMILVEAIKKAKTLNTEAIVSSLEKTDYEGVASRYVLYGRGHKYPHDVIFGPKVATSFAAQWQDGKLVPYWPDGEEAHQALIEAGCPSGWKGLKYPGTGQYKLPPWVVKQLKK
jgi:branched-chain amino acid transport system substrate-binding protein